MRLRTSRASGLLVAGVLTASAALAGCNQTASVPPLEAQEGNPDQGAQLIQAYGCGTCHSIPGIEDANGLVGPPLDHFSRRSYIAGELRNSEENLQRWVADPQEVEPGTAMPDLGVTPADAADIVAYLYTLD